MRHRPFASAEAFEGEIGDPVLRQFVPECVVVEMRISAAARDEADVGDGLGAVGAEDFDELVELARGVADGEDRGHFSAQQSEKHASE